MARLQAEMGSIRIWRSNGVVRSVRTHLAARHCSIQQVSAPIQSYITHPLPLHFTLSHCCLKDWPIYLPAISSLIYLLTHLKTSCNSNAFLISQLTLNNQVLAPSKSLSKYLLYSRMNTFAIHTRTHLGYTVYLW